MLFLYHSRPIQSVGSLKSLYTSRPGRPVHSDTNSTSPGSILATQPLRAETIHSHFHHCQVLIYTAEWTEASWRDRKCPNFETVAKRDLNIGSLDCESGSLPLSYAPLHLFI